MNHIVHHAWTRRASLLALGTAALAALGRPSVADSKKNGKKRKNKRNKGDANKLCKKQGEQCLDRFLPTCGNDPECMANAEQCCALAAGCELASFLSCLVSTGLD